MPAVDPQARETRCVRHLRISADQAGQRIDNFLLRELKGVPRSRVYRLLRKGEVRVNGGRAQPTYRLLEGDTVRLPPVRSSARGEAPPPSARVEQRLEQAVLHEDSELIVLDKPTGLAVHGGSGLAYGVVEAMRRMRPDCPALDLAHRLDRDTSGCLVLAKRRSMLRRIHALLREGAMDKRYLALVGGALPADVMPVEAPLAPVRGPGGETRMRVSGDGKPARSVFRRRRRYPGYTLAEVELHTGRMHQIRVHAAHLGHAVAGDSRYGDPESDRGLRTLGLRRLFLHAARLAFEPEPGRRLEVEAPLAPDLQAVLAQLEEQGS